jgi:phage shock protein A
MLERSEDPVRLIDQYLYSLRDEIQQADKLLAQYTAHTNGLRQQYLHAEQLKEKREQQALMALKAGEESVARLALQEKILHEEKAEQYKELYEQNKRMMLELETQINQMKHDYQLVYDKRQYYAARIESLRLAQRLNERWGTQAQTGGAPRMFERLEDRVSDLELEVNSLRDLRRMDREISMQAGASNQSVLDRELQALKRKLEQGG